MDFDFKIKMIIKEDFEKKKHDKVKIKMIFLPDHLKFFCFFFNSIKVNDKCH